MQADDSLGASPVYRTAAAWDISTVTGLSDDRLYSFAAKARNGDGAETALGPAADAAGTPAVPAAGVAGKLALFAVTIVAFWGNQQRNLAETRQRGQMGRKKTG